jgi:hypothetical protein
MSALSFSIIVVATSILLLILTLQSNGLYSSLVLGFQSLDSNNNNNLNANDYQRNHDITFLSTSSSSSSESLSTSNDFCRKYLETCNGNQGTELEEDTSQEDNIINEFQRKYSEIIEENNNSDTGAGIEAPVTTEGHEPIVPQPMDSNLSATTAITNATMTDNYGFHPPGLE